MPQWVPTGDIRFGLFDLFQNGLHLLGMPFLEGAHDKPSSKAEQKSRDKCGGKTLE